MAEEASDKVVDGQIPEGIHGAVIVGMIPDLPDRVLQEAGRYASLLGAHLLVVHVDVTRFVSYEDPDGYVHTAPIDINIAAGETDLAEVTRLAKKTLDGHDLDWSVRQLVGDPALAIKHLAEQVDAKLLVVGTRKRGLGESIREFFTGSVAARLAHRQHRPVLVVPLGEPVADDEDIWPS
ncbi:universal stress protein [Microbacterium xanthum]|uniref:universal stress protein n=1 Tax=Microbacterium xanthum TaxID=3079794 RepID=UPI002AD27C25|nr:MULTISPECIES: universal stress protein [unclassified Microbacterium]MDZ8171430.1 universal stress protein [Microbacterium sp. KSW-48]MDZ8200532.1 universal stress protein [Microbacterium sp. SSW1-59]